MIRDYRQMFFAGGDGGRVAASADLGDGLSVAQTAWRALSTERYAHVIHSHAYGLRRADLIGSDPEEAAAKLPQRITECVKMDSRVRRVEGFEFDLGEPGTVKCSFRLVTDFGSVPMSFNLEV